MNPNHGDGSGTSGMEDAADNNNCDGSDTSDGNGAADDTACNGSGTNDNGPDDNRAFDGGDANADGGAGDGSTGSDTDTIRCDDEEPTAKRPRLDTEDDSAYTAFDEADWPVGNNQSEMAR